MGVAGSLLISSLKYMHHLYSLEGVALWHIILGSYITRSLENLLKDIIVEKYALKVRALG